MALHIPPVLSGGSSAGAKRTALRELLAGPHATIVPGVFDALTAVMAERTGFEAAYVTGAGIANSQLAVPDVGLLQFDSLALQLRRLEAATQIPLIVDADTGFGGPTAVMYVVRTLESLGAAAIQIEDQVMPKRCGHFDGKSVVNIEEMQAKVSAAVEARADQNLVIIARTDAAAPEGIDAAIRRSRAYAEAGADVIFVEAPSSDDELQLIADNLRDVPLLINVVEGGRTPECSLPDLEALGYRLVLRANVLLRTMVHAGLACLAALRDPTLAMPPYISWEQRQDLVRLSEFDRLEEQLRARWRSPGTGAPAGDSRS